MRTTAAEVALDARDPLLGLLCTVESILPVFHLQLVGTLTLMKMIPGET